ncbi:NADPH-dependent 2,4-dienoyl-CoA reductase, sulfur reductase [Sporobacter termitidis DSM 10068]|uniref:NADPH-dependent 2,4-dienoyl-CoA reductase, sulfur reductase n=1 Tax=Sporobacter termitidis DSM 10068 TaxID=1123282 RepID=A0A1M5U6U5_9FIRM|nr:DsrE/DsrF/DrsH-like family protein [Sporobacter termitidis]SHH58679.1 NADPH-dependent 2,4-dienoyl-CoA reductase, sulfur reductase [Sporobacter termitidis DSM 10068]
MGKKVLIVGGVAGGASCAARLRRLDESAQIIVFERGDYISYANCGLPYHVGDVIKQRSALILQTPEAMGAKYNTDVRVRQEVTGIDRAAKTITVKKLDTGETYDESYDTLVLSTGSSPVRPPIPGIDSKRIMTLWTVPDTDRIRAYIGEHGVKSAVVVGGGFIGLEMAENLRHAGLEVSVVEMLEQVMAPLDFEMAQLVHEHLARKGVDLRLSDGVASFEETDGGVTVALKSGRKLTAGLVILSIGVRPNSELAKAAGLEVNARGGIVVNAGLRTSDPDIYAVGDVIEVEDFVDKGRAMVPLAGPANKQGRIAADNIAGGHETYDGTQGTSVAKIFDMTAAATGQSEKTLVKKGLVKGRDYETLIITQNSHASYYPGAVPMNIKLIFSKDGRRIYGAQIVGADGVDKRIDTIAAVIRLGGAVRDLKTLELAYAPPYSSAKDPVNMAGFVAENILTGKVAFAPWDADLTDGSVVALDVREAAEVEAYALPAYKHIPLGQLRKRLSELDRDSAVVTFCAIGVRSYNAARILMENGFKNVRVYPGGTRFYQSMHYKESEVIPMTNAETVADSGDTAKPAPGASMRLDCSGMQCPGPIMKVFEAMKALKDGESLEVAASDPGFARDIGAWARRTGNTLVSNEKRGSDYVALVRKGGAASAPVQASGAEGKTIIVFSGDLDKVLASFIIANGAAAMGRPVTMFFTFWGLNVLRRTNKVRVDKTFVESMFGGMMPRGASKLKLSKMHMLGMGTAMMKGIMKKKNVSSLEELIKKAQQNGVKIVACTMSMDVMGIKKEELIDGIDYAGVGTYLADAEESNVNLFI